MSNNYEEYYGQVGFYFMVVPNSKMYIYTNMMNKKKMKKKTYMLKAKISKVLMVAKA